MNPKHISAFKEVLTDRNAIKARAQVTSREVKEVQKLFSEINLNKSKLFWKTNRVRCRAAMASAGNLASSPEKSKVPGWIHVGSHNSSKVPGASSDRGPTPAR